MTSKAQKKTALRKRIAFSQNMIKDMKAEYAKPREHRASDGFLDLLIDLSENDIDQSHQQLRNL